MRTYFCAATIRLKGLESHIRYALWADTFEAAGAWEAREMAISKIRELGCIYGQLSIQWDESVAPARTEAA